MDAVGVTARRRPGNDLKPETWEEICHNARVAVASLDAHEQIRLAGLFASPRDWNEERRRWEE